MEAIGERNTNRVSFQIRQCGSLGWLQEFHDIQQMMRRAQREEHGGWHSEITFLYIALLHTGARYPCRSVSAGSSDSYLPMSKLSSLSCFRLFECLCTRLMLRAHTSSHLTPLLVSFWNLSPASAGVYFFGKLITKDSTLPKSA